MCPFKNKLIKICILICPLNGRASFYYVSVSLYAFRNNNLGVCYFKRAVIRIWYEYSSIWDRQASVAKARLLHPHCNWSLEIVFSVAGVKNTKHYLFINWLNLNLFC